MKLSLLLLLLPCAEPVLAQTITSFAPARNAAAAPRNSALSVTLSAPAGPSAAAGLKIFSTQAGGKKSGMTTVSGNTVTFVPATHFAAGETLMATLASGASAPQVWQFTAAATGGTGSFGSSSTLSVPNGAGPFRLADVDSDGDLDLITFGIVAASTGSNPDGLIQVHLNNGLGAFTTASDVIVPEYFNGVAGYNLSISLADVDADGDIDILASSTRPEVYVLANNAAGRFMLASTVPTGAQSSLSIATGDIDGDGDIDFIATNRGGSSHTFTSGTAAGINDGSGRFTTRATGILFSPTAIEELKDVNGDGALDVIVKVGGGLYVCPNTGAGTFGSLQLISASGEGIYSWAFEDFDADGDLDVVVVANSSCTTCGPVVKIMTNNGTGIFSSNGAVFSHSPPGLYCADVNGDGRPDLILTGYGYSSSPADSMKVLRNLGSGNFSSAAAYVVPRNEGILALGDLDGDDDIDIVASTYANANFGSETNTLLNGLGPALGTTPPAATSFRCWPNPVSTANALHVALPIPGTRTLLRLTTVLGQLVRVQTFAGSSATISTDGLAAGLYLLSVQADGQVPLTRRVAVE